MKKIIKLLFVFQCSLVFCLMTACKPQSEYTPERNISVVLLNGSHYSVLGENKQSANNGDTVTFQIELERGYKAVSSFGDECEVSQDLSFVQTVTFSNVRYNMTSQIKTEEMSVHEFETVCDSVMGEIGINSTLGAADGDLFYEDDIISLTAQPKSGHRFVCWSSGNYINNGGSFFDYNPILENVDFANVKSLYANFKDITNTKNTLVYKFDDGIEIEQDCSVQREHYSRANTLTAQDLRERGIDCDSRMLVGWNNEQGEYIGLGSRIATADKEVILFPVWRDYTPSEYFTVNNGILTGFSGKPNDDGEIVIPNKVGNETITAIGANTFRNCSAKTYYLPDTVLTVEANAFLNCDDLKEFYMSDNIVSITDEAFKGCANFETLHINAYLKPGYTTNEANIVTESYDRLAMGVNSDIRRVAILGGSGTQAGYSCSIAAELFEETGEIVEVYNFGWSAAYCGLAQFEVINSYLKPGDIFLHAPEQYNGALCGETAVSPLTNEECIALTDGNPYVFRFSENNWEFISKLTVKNYANLFSMFTVFNEGRVKHWLPECEYSDYCTNVVEEGYGYRPTNEQVFYENGTDKSFGGAKDIIPFASRFKLTKKYMYKRLKDGVNAYVTFPTLNKSNLLLTYGDEEKAKAASEEYTRQVKDILSDMNLQVLLTQYDTVYDGRYFFNHDYHLGYPCRDRHTVKVISALIDNLKSTGVIS